VRTRGYAFVEFLCAIALTLGTVLLLGNMGTVALRWHETLDRTIAIDAAGDRVRLLVGEALRAGRPIEALSLTEKGELVEAPVAGAVSAWSAREALLLRGADAYVVVEREGSRLIRRRIGFDGRASSEQVAAGVQAASFDLVTGRSSDERASGERLQGVGYHVAFTGRTRPVEGFCAVRVEELASSPPRAPRPAEKWGGK
jgi:hypothetical protein